MDFLPQSERPMLAVPELHSPPTRGHPEDSAGADLSPKFPPVLGRVLGLMFGPKRSVSSASWLAGREIAQQGVCQDPQPGSSVKAVQRRRCPVWVGIKV